MIIFSMFFWRSKKERSSSEAELWERINLLMVEIEGLKKEAETKIGLIEECAVGRCRELEAKLKVLEERILLLNQVVVSSDPDKRNN